MPFLGQLLLMLISGYGAQAGMKGAGWLASKLPAGLAALGGKTVIPALGKVLPKTTLGDIGTMTAGGVGGSLPLIAAEGFLGQRDQNDIDESMLRSIHPRVRENAVEWPQVVSRAEQDAMIRTLESLGIDLGALL